MREAYSFLLLKTWGGDFLNCAKYTIQNLRDALFSEIQQRVESVTDFGSVVLAAEMVGKVGYI